LKTIIITSQIEDQNKTITQTVGVEDANFSSSGTSWIDPSLGITSTTWIFTNTSFPLDANFVWDVNSVQKSTDTNFSYTFTVVGDYNIFLEMDSAGRIFGHEETVSISELTQNVDINHSLNDFSVNDANINFGVTHDGSANAYNWGLSDGNFLTRNFQTTFTSSGVKEICVTITSISDVNKTFCENFYVGRLIVSIPKDIESGAVLSPFSLTASAYPAQSYTGLTADSNIFVFRASTNFNSEIGIDFNSDYYPTARTFTFNSFEYSWEPLLVASDGTNLEATIFTINNSEGRVTISGIKIDSYTDVNSVSTIVESKYSDGTGQAVFHFVKGQEYTLNFFDSDGVLLTSETIEVNDTEYFVFLETGGVSVVPVPSIAVGVDWYPLIGNVVAVDQNVSFWQLLKPTNGTICDVNVWITHVTDSNIVYNQVFSVNSSSDYNLSYDLNIAGFNDSFPLKISLQIFDGNATQVNDVRTKSYSFKDTKFKQAVEQAKDALGQFGVTLIALIFIVIGIGFFTSKAIGEDMNLPALVGAILFSIPL